MARLEKERAELNAALIRTGDRVKETEAEMTAIEVRLGELEQQERALRTSLNSQHKSIGRLLSAIQRMGRNPPPVMITRRSDALAMVRSAMLLARAFPKLRAEAQVLSSKLNRLVALMSGIRTESERLKARSKELNAHQSSLADLMRTKRQSLGSRQVELAEVTQTVKVIGQNVQNLEELITKLGDTTIDRKIAAANPPGSVPLPGQDPNGKSGADKLRELQIALNAPPNPAAPPQPNLDADGTVKKVVVRPTIAPSGAAYDLTPDGDFIGNTARMQPAIPFHRAKGQLPLPAAGLLETQFGEQTKFGGRSKGIVIRTRPGAQITSPADGWVVYAGKFRTYGQLLIIKAGEGYHVLLAGLSRIDVQSGQFVLAAEPVGTMKSAPNQRATDHDSPRLYVEFRKEGRPINPRPWWSASSRQKVQG
ncbi:MAG: peptidoglycan DD-metalloendopeptidase family protein [Alphaproteobacteria bacterium]|nr:peptidoglycan DD-metalloendopeptidase family protein [Alphaproteobacteria bacterium]